MITITLSETLDKKGVRIAVKSRGKLLSETTTPSWDEAIDEVRAIVADPPAEPPPPRSRPPTT